MYRMFKPFFFFVLYSKYQVTLPVKSKCHIHIIYKIYRTCSTFAGVDKSIISVGAYFMAEYIGKHVTLL